MNSVRIMGMIATFVHLGVASLGIASLLMVTFAITLVRRRRPAVPSNQSPDIQKIPSSGTGESPLHLRTLAEAIPQMIWTARADGSRDYVNQRWCDYTGLDLEQASGSGWEATLHPDDLDLCLKKWEECIRTGEALEVEYRLRRAADGAYHWHLARALPLKDSLGSVVKWFGTCTNIDDQKHSQEILEQQIRQRTEELTASNENMKREMWEREQIQNDLDQQNVAMVAEITKRSERTVLLSKMGKLLQSAINMDEAVSIMLGFAPKIFPDFRGALILVDAARSLLEVKGSWAGCKMPAVTTFDMCSCWALRTGQRHFVEVGDPTAPCVHANTATDPYLCVPIMTQEGAAGVLHLQAILEARDPFESELLIANSFAEQVAVSIANLRLQEALRQQSTSDALTGLYNRRYLEESLERELRRAERAKQPVSLVMFDLDHFKTFNDTFGHAAGDAVLREMGAAISRTARAEDISCRFGGEEFLLILPSTTLEGGRTRAERVRAQARKLAVMHQGRSVGTITVSIGVAAFPVHGLSARELIASADAALYRAKNEGRNRVVVAETEECFAAGSTN